MLAKLKSADCIIVICALFFLLVAPFIGVLDIGFAKLFDFSPENVNAQVFWSLRLPRVVAGFLIGAALALCGVTFQALFHNPLASPFTLGVSSGAACGVAISVVCGLSLPFAGISPHSLAALLGALFTIFLVHTAGRKRLGLSGVSMLLVGVIINFFFGSIVVFLQYLSDLTQLFSLMRWLMGSLEIVGIEGILPLFVATAFTLIWLVGKSQELDIISLGDELALARGVAVKEIQQKVFLASSILIALAVTLAGPIGFIGIVVPHAVRLMFGPHHQGLLLRSALLGGVMVVFCDTIGRVIMPPAEIPVGVITSLIGAPLFVAILISKRSGQIFR
jgi:iron complex transport system permease protein